MFVPLAERLYGKYLLVLYFGTDVLGQTFHYWWRPTSGGSSGAAFAVMGGLVTYVLRNRRFALKPFVVISIVPPIAACVLAAFRDGHGPSLLIGALVAVWLPAAEWVGEKAEASFTP